MDQKIILLDTSILIDYYRKKNKANSKLVTLAKKYDFSISVITRLEILTGINKKQEDFWSNVFNEMKVLPLFENDVDIAANIIRTLRKENQIIGLKDILIASTALANDLSLATLNFKDFERIKGLYIIEN